LEVRLLEHDRVILAGLNEGTWPQTTRNDAFLNRLMRQELGMSSPERRTGLAAHDFQQLMGKGEIFLSRSSRVDKSPTVASRWIQRLAALIGEDQTKILQERGQTYLGYADALDKNEERSKRVERPNPNPPIAARPTSLAVTDIETWIRDPYALYAKRILKLNPLEPLERDPDPMLKGTLYHAIMQDYVEAIDVSKPAHERLAYLKELSNEHIEDENLPPDVSNIWQLRFYEIAEAYIEWEENYHLKQKITKTLCESAGINNLSYIRLRRGTEFKVQSIANNKRSLDDIINNAEAELLKLIKGYQFLEQGYQSRRAPFKILHGYLLMPVLVKRMCLRNALSV